MHVFGNANIGQDAELRQMPDGTPVVNVNCAFNYGRPNADGERKTQWAEFGIFGGRATSLAPHLTKGKTIFVVAEDCAVQEYTKRDGGHGVKLVGRITSLDFVGKKRE